MGFERMFVPELSGLLIIDYGRHTHLRSLRIAVARH